MYFYPLIKLILVILVKMTKKKKFIFFIEDYFCDDKLKKLSQEISLWENTRKIDIVLYFVLT